MRNQEIFQMLIAVGKCIEENSEPSKALIDSLAPHSRVSSRSRLTNSEFCSFTNVELILLLKGLVYAERELDGWWCGSVSSVKAVIDALQTRDIDIEQFNELADWFFHNSKGWYAMGRRYKNPRDRYGSDAEYQRAMDAARAWGQRDEHRKQREKDAEGERQLRKARRLASHRDRNSPVRPEIISKLSNMNIHDQLAMIAEDDTYAPNFFPGKCASSARIEEIESLSANIKEKLVLKLKGKQRGPWGGFKKRLLLVYEPTNDHR
jgi:hypothetical protein